MTPRPKKEKLKPCPFCGRDWIKSFRSKEYTVHIACIDCGASVGEYPNIANAIAAWNRRGR